MTDQLRTMDYGFNYLPTIELIDHFGPYWIERRCSYEQMRCDLLAMRAMNSRFVRFHIMPANPERDSQPGADPIETPKDMHKAVEFARLLGMRVHWDISSQDILTITEQEVRDTVSEYEGLVQSYQIGNEPYFCWSASDKYYEHVQKLIAVGKEVDPQAKFSVDIFSTDLAYMRKNFAGLYTMLDMVMIHYYSMDDTRGWSDVYIEQLVHYAGGKDNRFQDLRDENFIEIEFYPGTYGDFDKDIWITETTGAGFHRYAGQVDEDLKARNWEKVCRAVAERTDVTLLAHHCVRDKMSWREFGTSQCGVMNVDGSPKPLAYAQQKMAHASLPDSDLAKWVDVSLSVQNQALQLTLENKLERELRGELSFDGVGSIRANSKPTTITLAANSTSTLSIPLTYLHPDRCANSQVFCLFRAKEWESECDNAVGWVSVRREQEFAVDLDVKPLKGVRYPTGVEAVQDFFKRFSNPTVISGGLIDFDAEMAYRLKSVIGAKSGLVVDTAAIVNAGQYLDRPLVIVGNPEHNYYAQLVEWLAPPECRVSAENPSFVAVIKEPFHPHQWASSVANAIGYAYCPACIYVAGIDERHIQRAAYDLIRRLWTSKDVEVVDRQVGENPIEGVDPARFRVDLDPGDYRISMLVGKAGAGHYTNIECNGAKFDGIWTDQSAQSFTFFAEAKDGHLEFCFYPKAGMIWAVAGMEIAHAGLLADYRNFVFSSQPEAEELPQGATLVTKESRYSAEKKFGWV